jgi:single-stranded-DNA-specific exonuclease
VSLTASKPAPQWLLRPPPSERAISALAAALEVHPQAAAVLAARGVRAEQAALFDPPFELSAIPDLSAAAQRLIDAIEKGRRIRIHGDYDADGVSGTAVLTLGLRALGAKVDPFIPNRLSDGYGINPERIAEHIEAAELFLTVDCGITNLAEIEALQRAGVEVIISDHHTPAARDPDCLVVHPKRAPSARAGAPELTGSGVAYHLIWAVHRQLGLEDPLHLTDLAAIGTIADVAPLMGENRALVKVGLAQMPHSRSLGVQAMLNGARIQGTPDAVDVAFRIAPRINAAGRLGAADRALELLITSDSRAALRLANDLEALNRERGVLQERMLEEAMVRVDPNDPAVVIGDEAWHPGVMGLVASKLLELHGKPVFITAAGKGSVRSTPGISAVGGLEAARAHLKRWGGHPAAAGFALDMANFAAFKRAICDYVAAHPPHHASVVLDAQLDVDAVDAHLFEALQPLQPFGEGNRTPTFAIRANLHRAQATRDGAHLQLQLRGPNSQAPRKGIAFRRGPEAADFAAGFDLDTAAELTRNEWNGSVNIELMVRELRLPQPLGVGDEHGAAEATPLLVRRGCSDAAQRLDPFAAELFAQLNHSLATAAGQPLELCLDEGVRREFRRFIASVPSVAELRSAYVARRKGIGPDPSADPASKAGRIERALLELGLTDEHQAARPAVKISPFASASFRGAHSRAVLLQNLQLAFDTLSDEAFATALVSMAEPTGAPTTG